MVEGEIDCRWTASVVSDWNNLIQVQRFDNRFEIVLLLLETVTSARRFVGSSKTEEIERNAPAPCGDQMRDQLIVDVQVVGETVHQHKGGTGARVVTYVDSSLLPRNIAFDKGWFGVHVAISS
jgi:hypothetical protein